MVIKDHLNLQPRFQNSAQPARVADVPTGGKKSRRPVGIPSQTGAEGCIIQAFVAPDLLGAANALSVGQQKLSDDMDDNFNFDIKAKRVRISDGELIKALENAANIFNGKYFTSIQYGNISGNKPNYETIINRFGSWRKALLLIGIEGGREKKYDPEELITNIEIIWKELGYPPGKRNLKDYGKKISEGPYKHHWGSVRAACKAVASYHDGKITREKLLSGNTGYIKRIEVPLNVRWTVLKRDNYCCIKCGASPSNDHDVILEVDHIRSIAKGGTNDINNLQTLCRKCNQGKKEN